MAGGLVALLDDIAALTKLAAASLDDVTAAAGRAGVKAAGVVIDDTAVTPRYVTGLSPARELPIIGKIALGSLRNKLLILLPAALALSALAPWAITPILMLGGAYLCFEGTEKVFEAITGTGHGDEVAGITDPKELEDRQVGGAVRTDLILSAEIMAIALADLSDLTLVKQGLVLGVVGIAITVGVYGMVAVIVKMDDIGLHLAQRDLASVQAIGRGMVKAMPVLLQTLSTIGIAAMIWVGGGIILHGLETFGLGAIAHGVHDLAEAAGNSILPARGLVEWIVGAAGAAVVGGIVGGLVVAAMHLVPRRTTTG
jgi:predicted DNA repair protein MutK